jgi:KDO2-lipid IV(A) lauroyltransferase
MRVLGRRSRKHKRILQNLTVLLPDSTESELEQLAGEIWTNLGFVLAEFPRLKEICAEAKNPRLTVVVEGGCKSLYPLNRPKIFIGAHLGNWELAAAAVTKLGIPLTVTYTPNKNPRIAAMVRQKRRALGCSFVKKAQGMRPLVQALSRGQSLGFLVDSRMDEGRPLPFAGRITFLTTGPARLALRYGADLVPIRVKRLGDANYEVTIERPIKLNRADGREDEQVMQLTRLVYARIENWVRAEPQNWLCTKRMWPKSASRLASSRLLDGSTNLDQPKAALPES